MENIQEKIIFGILKQRYLELESDFLGFEEISELSGFRQLLASHLEMRAPPG